MSCIGKFQSFEGAPKVPSAAYYNLTSIAGTIAGTTLYESSLSSGFNDFIGFDWTKHKLPNSSVLNRMGEPTTSSILNYHNISVAPEVKKGMEAIETLFEEGYMGASFVAQFPLRMKVNAMALNPRFEFVNANVFSTGTQFFMRAKATANPSRKRIDKDFLRNARFLNEVIDVVDEFAEGNLNQLIDRLLEEDMLPFQRTMLQTFRRLSSANPTLKLAIFDTTERPLERSFFDPRTNTIFITKDITVSQSKETLIRELIHEAAHSYTLSAINNPRTPEEIKFRNTLKRVYEDMLLEFPQEDIPYGMTNLEEFAAEFMSNPTFRASVQEYEATMKSSPRWVSTIMQALREFFRNLFGLPVINKGTDLDNAIEEYLTYLEERGDVPLTFGEEYLRFAPVRESERLSSKAFNTYFKKVIRANQKVINLGTSNTQRTIKGLNTKFEALASSKSMSEIFTNAIEYFEALNAVFEKDQNGNTSFHRYIERLAKDARTKDEHVLNYLEDLNNKLTIWAGQLDAFYNFIDQLSKEAASSSEFKNEFYVFLTNFIENTTIKEFQAIPDVDRADINKILPYFKRINQTVNTQINDIVSRSSKEIKLRGSKIILEHVSQDHLESFREELQEEIDQLTKEIELHERTIDEKNLQENSPLVKLTQSLIQRRELMMFHMEASRSPEKFAALITSEDFVATGNWSGLWSPGEFSRVPVISLFKNFLSQHRIDVEKEFIQYHSRLTMIHEKLSKYRGKTNYYTKLKGQKFAESFYKGLTRRVTVFELNEETGEISENVRLAFNTRLDHVKFRNEHILFKSEVIKKLKKFERLQQSRRSTQEDLEIARQEWEAALKAEQEFLAAKAERPYIDAYYEVERILENETQEEQDLNLKEEISNRQNKILEQLEALESIENLLNEDVEDLRKELNRELKELRNERDRDGNLKQGIDYMIAVKLQRYYNARAEMNIMTYSVPEYQMNLFLAEKETYEKNLVDLSNRRAAAQTIEEQDALSDELRQVQEEYKRWLSQNTRREIDPIFWEEKVAPILDEISEIHKQYSGDDPQITEKWNKIFQIVYPKRDNNNVPDGNLFGLNEAQAVKGLQEEIEELKKELEETSAMPAAAKNKLKSLYRALASLQSRQPTRYYYTVYSKKETELGETIYQRDQALVDKATNQAYDELIKVIEAHVNGQSHTVNRKLYFFANRLETEIEDLFNTNDWNALMQNFTSNMDDIKNILRGVVLKHMVKLEMEDSDWYKANHITKTRKVTNNYTGEVEIEETTEPIYFWMEYLPNDQRYINPNAPSSKWASYQTNPAYINKNFKPNEPSPREGLAEYENPEYMSLDPELRDIVDEYIEIYDEYNRMLPMAHRVQSFLVPATRKTFGEHINSISSLKFQPKVMASGIFMSIKNLFSDSSDESDYKEQGSLEYITADGKKRLVRGVRKRFLSPLNTFQQSHDIHSVLLKFGEYSLSTKYLLKSAPTAYGIYNAVSQESSQIAEQTLKELENEVYMTFVGRSKDAFVLSTNATKKDAIPKKFIQILITLMGKLRGLTTKAVMDKNFLRAPKNFMQPMKNIFMNSRRYKMTEGGANRAFARAIASRRAHLNLTMGTKDIAKETALFVKFNFVPTADTSSFAQQGDVSMLHRNLSFELLRSSIIGASDYIPAATIGFFLMGNVMVDVYDSSGNITQVPIEEAYDYSYEKGLTPKQGVYGYDKARVEQAQADYFAYEQNIRIKNGFPLDNSITPQQKAKLNVLTKVGKAKLDSVLAEENAKLKSLYDKEIYVRNEAYYAFYHVFGQYHARSKARWRDNEFLQFVLLLKGSWAIPGIQNYFGNRKEMMLFGRVHTGAYNVGNYTHKLKTRAAYLRSGLFNEAFQRLEPKPNYTVGQYLVKVARSPILRDTLATVATRALNRYIQVSLLHYAFALATKATGSDDDEESWLRYLAYLTGIIISGIDDEISTFTNPIMMGLDAMTKFEQQPFITKDEQNKGYVFQAQNFVNYALLDGTVRSADNVINALFNPKVYSDPFGEYQDFNSKKSAFSSNTKSIYAGKPNYLVAFMTLSGYGALDAFSDPKRRLRTGYMYNPKYGINTPYSALAIITDSMETARENIITELRKLNVYDEKTGIYKPSITHLSADEQKRMQEVIVKNGKVIRWAIDQKNALSTAYPRVIEEAELRQINSSISSAITSMFEYDPNILEAWEDNMENWIIETQVQLKYDIPQIKDSYINFVQGALKKEGIILKVPPHVSNLPQMPKPKVPKFK